MSGPETKPLLVEIGCEEIPARFLTNAQRHFGEKLKVSLSENRLLPDHSEVNTYSTPRRLVAHLPVVLTHQDDLEVTVQGPSLKAAYDIEGRPTRAAESFAAKNGQTVADLTRVQTPKGEYVALIRRTAGRAAEDLLGEILSGVITSLEFPKSMVWPGKNGMRFVRPIRWILVHFGADQESVAASFPIISGLAKEFSGAGIAVGYETRGHRSLGLPGPIAVENFDDYSKKLRENFVEFDPSSRLAKVKNQVQALLDKNELKLVGDSELEEWIVNSTEWPRAILGGFDRRFLALPREILITVMRGHQHYFAVEDHAGNLAPHFITVLNMDGDPKGLIRHGHERVLTARFRDAEFFWQADQKIPLRDRLPMLDRVTYQKDLGTYGDKVRRMRMIATEICQLLEGQEKITSQETNYALRAVELSKCDLTTQMVQEFTELQGIVGGLYAAAQGEPQAVADAIYDQYRPVGLEGDLPRSLVGAVVSLADKIDSVVGGFLAGIEPTGSSDPFGLRRAGNGIVKVLVEREIAWSYLHLITVGLRAHQAEPSGNMADRLEFFLTERLAFYVERARGYRPDTFRAVRAVGIWSVVEAVGRAEALENIRDTEDFVSLSIAAKRTRNILTKSAKDISLGGLRLDESLLEPGAERELYEAYLQAFETVTPNELIAGSSSVGVSGPGYIGDPLVQLQRLATLRPAVDRFFENVMVMVDDEKLRLNRLLLLKLLDNHVFSAIVSLSEIAPGPAHVDASTSKAPSEKR
ncbi:MAG TPA: glycine--tRNA ligase subunit beta [Terriglobia bacterium]|nr:glycine--tRNA ligase subunit beta [Terriglobia bacterium]